MTEEESSHSEDEVEYLVEEINKIRHENAGLEENINEFKHEIQFLNKNIEYIDESLKDLYARFGGDIGSLPENVWARMKLIFEYFQDRVYWNGINPDRQP